MSKEQAGASAPSRHLKSLLPQELWPLAELAGNYWWCWNNQFDDIWRDINPALWAQCHNPITTLLETPKDKLRQLGENKDYLSRMTSMSKAFHAYMESSNTWYQRAHKREFTNPIVYFCAEYALHESLPIYSGGLGVLAGDHVKSASDLGVPELFIGLLYREGYFVQKVDASGHQVDEYKTINLDHQALELVLADSGDALRLSAPWGREKIEFQVWRVPVGRTSIYLLDLDVPENSEEIRRYGKRLYGGDRRMRLAQEIVLGIGGERLLKALHISPSVYHMNEGHSGFFQLERLIGEMKSGMSLEAALEQLRRSTVFTTHTPVPAGNEVFSLPLLYECLAPYLAQTNLAWSEFANLGVVKEKPDWTYFSLTVFALKTSHFANGVSELHGRVSRRMWSDLWPSVPSLEVPIQSITNGVHVPTWASAEVKNLFSSQLGEAWTENQLSPDFWQVLRNLPVDELIAVRKRAKTRLIDLVRSRLREQWSRQGHSTQGLESFLRESDLIIGFARRFATYKRATLLLSDIKRLKRLVDNPDRPLRFVFAGKAHPADKPGQAFIEKIYALSVEDDFRGKIIFLENYDMNISRHMVAACDVWLNTPRRPFEASGTSGQKVPLNGGLNFSVLDGWWREGFNGHNGWPIGQECDFLDEKAQDREDSESFYEVLESTILPLFFTGRGQSLYSNAWIGYVKESMATLLPAFNTDRMVRDYVEQLYLPAHRASKAKSENHRDLSKKWPSVFFSSLNWPSSTVELKSHHDEYLQSSIHQVEFAVDATLPGQPRRFSGELTGLFYCGDINPSELVCELVITDDADKHLFALQQAKIEPRAKTGEAYFAITPKLERPETARFRLRLRVKPLPELPPNNEGLMLWC